MKTARITAFFLPDFNKWEPSGSTMVGNPPTISENNFKERFDSEEEAIEFLRKFYESRGDEIKINN